MGQRRRTDRRGDRTPTRWVGPPGEREAVLAFWVALGVALTLSAGVVAAGALPADPVAGVWERVPVLRHCTATAWGVVIVAGVQLLRR